MANRRLPMRKTQEILRLHFAAGLTRRQIASSCSVSRSTVSEYIYRAEGAVLDWERIRAMSPGELEAKLFSKPPYRSQGRPQPDFAAIHRQLRRKHVTLLDKKPLAQPVDYGDERLDVGRAARPHLAAKGHAFAVDHDAHDHLGQVGPMVAAAAALAQRLASASLEEGRGGVEEDQIQGGEQVATALEQPLLDQVLAAAARPASAWPGTGGAAAIARHPRCGRPASTSRPPGPSRDRPDGGARSKSRPAPSRTRSCARAAANG